MYRIVLVDDEPLILAGIASLIAWEDYDCTIVGKATNGPSAYDMIMDLKPDIVITDIRMPVLDGLELVEKCKNAGNIFAFIVLTNLEEFHLAKKALSLGAAEYLVKLNLSPSELVSALEKAKTTSSMLKGSPGTSPASNSTLPFKEQFKQYLTRHLLLHSEGAPIPENLSSLCSQMVLFSFSIRYDSVRFLPEEETANIKQLSSHIMDILTGISDRFFEESAILPSDASNTFLMAAVLRGGGGTLEDSISMFCKKSNTALKTYFELTAVFGISTIVGELSRLEECFQQSRTALEYYYYDSSCPIVFYTGQSIRKSSARDFNINFLKKDLASSIQQNDSAKLHEIFRQIIDLFTECKPGKEHAASACINIYTYLYSFFDNAGNTYQDIFPYAINIAEYLNQFTCLSDILKWLQNFCDQLCQLLDDRKNHTSDKLIEKAKRYIDEHYTEKLTLAQIAEQLNISAGHLSTSFRKYTGVTLSDYIVGVKIEHAKELIDSHQYLMYEISDMLGFETPYYFSKVFKKVAGVSPREYEKRM